MLKRYILDIIAMALAQPPSGGCVLKQQTFPIFRHKNDPAAFGRLCVETICRYNGSCLRQPAAFGRLCVETRH